MKLDEFPSGDPNYKRVIANPQRPQKLKAVKWTAKIKGTHVQIPSSLLFIAEDGSVYVVTDKQGQQSDYTSLDSLIETLKKTVIITNV